MKPTAKARLIQQVQKLITEGDAVLATKFNNSSGNFVDMGDPWVEPQAYQKWLTSCRNLAHQVGKPAQIWIDAFEGSASNQHVVATSHLGSLKSLLEAVQDDLLSAVEDLIAADAFGSLLEQAEFLLTKTYLLASGVLCRAVLEEHLRLLCDRHGCLPAGRPTINDLNQALYKNGHLDKLAMQQVTAMATAGNHCAHNERPPLTQADVEKLHREVTDFLVRQPLP